MSPSPPPVSLMHHLKAARPGVQVSVAEQEHEMLRTWPVASRNVCPLGLSRSLV